MSSINGLLSTDARNPLDAGIMSADSGPDKTRAQNAFRAIEGHDVGFFELNPWRPIKDFDSSFNLQVQANGGVVMVVKLSDPVSFGDSDRLALLWDDTAVSFGPEQVTQGSRVLVTVPDVKGQRATFWCTSDLVATVKETSPLILAESVRQREAALIAAEKAADDAKPNPVSKFLDAYLKTAGTVGVVAAIALGVGVYFWLKAGGLKGGV